MKKIALVSVTLNAVNPMTEYLNQKEEPLEIRNYLDSYILQKVKEEGRINDSSMLRMFQMLATACTDGADGVIMTCTIFSPYAEYFSALLSKPVVCPDGAMLDAVAGKEGKTAIICTFTGTVETTKNMYYSYCRKYRKPEEVDMYVVPEAYEAANRGDFVVFDATIQEKIKELDPLYDHVVLAQISMARTATGVNMNHATLYTSPDSAWQAMMEVL